MPTSVALGAHFGLQELRAAINAGAASGPGVDVDVVFDRLTQKYQAAADSGKSAR